MPDGCSLLSVMKQLRDSCFIYEGLGNNSSWNFEAFGLQWVKGRIFHVFPINIHSPDPRQSPGWAVSDKIISFSQACVWWNLILCFLANFEEVGITSGLTQSLLNFAKQFLSWDLVFKFGSQHQTGQRDFWGWIRRSQFLVSWSIKPVQGTRTWIFPFSRSVGVEVCVNPAVGCLGYRLTVLAAGSSRRDGGGGGEAVDLLHESILWNSPSLEVFKEQACSGSVSACSKGVLGVPPQTIPSLFKCALFCFLEQGWGRILGPGKQPGCAESLPRFPLALPSTFLSGVWLFHGKCTQLLQGELCIPWGWEQSVQPGMDGWTLRAPQGSSKYKFKPYRTTKKEN